MLTVKEIIVKCIVFYRVSCETLVVGPTNDNSFESKTYTSAKEGLFDEIYPDLLIPRDTTKSKKNVELA